MAAVCAVSGCRSRPAADDLSFLGFAADPSRHKRWEDALGWKAKDHTRVCSHHFISGKPGVNTELRGHYWQ